MKKIFLMCLCLGGFGIAIGSSPVFAQERISSLTEADIQRSKAMRDQWVAQANAEKQRNDIWMQKQQAIIAKQVQAEQAREAQKEEALKAEKKAATLKDPNRRPPSPYEWIPKAKKTEDKDSAVDEKIYSTDTAITPVIEKN